MNRHKSGKAAVLFSGGDAPGMNAELRAFVRLAANRYERNVLGVKDGYRGLARTCQRIFRGQASLANIVEEIGRFAGSDGLRRRGQDLVRLDCDAVSGIVSRGGIILGCARCDEFHSPDVRKQVIDLLADLNVEALVVCGGNGSFAGAECLANESSLQVIGIPATIDNDIGTTEMALGADTAVNTIVSTVRRFNDTADSHHRIIVLEIMGRDSGYLAEMAAMASGAEIVVTPERPSLSEAKLRGIASRIEELMLAGRRHAIVLVAEGAKVEKEVDPGQRSGPTKTLTDYLTEHFRGLVDPLGDIEVRSCVLGHMQRGGPPSAADCILAARFAEAALEAIGDQPTRSGALGLVGSEIQLSPFGVAGAVPRAAGRDYQLQKDLSDRRSDPTISQVSTMRASPVQPTKQSCE